MNVVASRSQLRASFLRWALLSVPAVMLAGFFSASLSGSGAENFWFASLVKPEISPPAETFPIVWGILYLAMGLSLAFVCAAWGARGRFAAILVFLLQLAANLLWSPLFFIAHQITAALYVLIALDVLVLITIILFWRVRKLAALLLLPYLAWILFATAINYEILQLNPGADGGPQAASVQRFEI